MTRRRTLDGLLIVEIAETTAPSYCSLVLADLGARVIKVEQLGRDRSESGRNLQLLRNKESCLVDLGSAEGLGLLRRLIRVANVIVSDISTEDRRTIGIGKEDVAELNPTVVFCSLTAFGHTGPWGDQPATETTLQALSGGMSMTGDPDGSPRRTWIPIAELCGGLWGAIAVLAGLRAEERAVPIDREIDLSLLDGQLAMIPYFSAYYFLDGVVPGPQGSGGHSPTYGAFECSDGRHVIIAVIDQAPWRRLCNALECTELTEDPRFAAANDRHEHCSELRHIIETIFASRPIAEWEMRLEDADLAFARVNRIDEAFTDPQVEHRQMRNKCTNGFEFVRTPVGPLQADDYRPPPAIGQHTDSVLSDLGFDGEELGRLRRAGVI